VWTAIAVVVVAAACGLVLALVVRWRAGMIGRRPLRSATSTLDPTDLLDVASRLAALDVGEVRQRDELVARRLRPLIDKRVPLRVVEPVPGLRTVRIRFADGTAVMGHGEAAGDAGVLAAMLLRQAVFVRSCDLEVDGTHLRFQRVGRRRLVSFVVTGFDQPD
jgi:hypothetical protein